MSSFDSETKCPYYSTRVRISDITSPKAWIGYKERTIEITYGNQESRKITIDKDDLANIEERSIKDDILKAFTATDEVAKARGFKFVDETKKNDKGEPISKGMPASEEDRKTLYDLPGETYE